MNIGAHQITTYVASHYGVNGGYEHWTLAVLLPLCVGGTFAKMTAARLIGYITPARVPRQPTNALPQLSH